MNIPLGTDAITAYRLAMEPDRKAPVTFVMSAWNAIDPEAYHAIDDLPDLLQREEDKIFALETVKPIHLTLDELITETFRLTSKRRGPNPEGWYDMSNISRTGNALGAGSVLKRSGDTRTFVGVLRDDQRYETRITETRFEIRPNPYNVDKPAPVITEVTCPGDLEPRMLEEQPSFGAAYRALLRMETGLIANGTYVFFHRNNEERRATFIKSKGTWIMDDRTPMRRRDPSDPVLYPYKHGEHVDTIVGFVSSSRRGRIFASVGKPVDDPGEGDAIIREIERKEAPDIEEARALLASRTDLDHIFGGVQEYDGIMGFWLSDMQD